MPVFANRPQLVHALLLAIDAAKRHARAHGERVTVSYAGDAESVTIRVATEPSTAPVKAGAVAPENTAPTAATLRASIASVGGPSDIGITEGEQLRIELPVPTLAAGRRAQLAARPTP